jgi:hypothetical protein
MAGLVTSGVDIVSSDGETRRATRPLREKIRRVECATRRNFCLMARGGTAAANVHCGEAQDHLNRDPCALGPAWSRD